MADSSRRQVSSPTAPAQALSPLVQLLPTGYRDIQPLQKGKGWHTNGGTPSKAPTSKLRRPRDAVANVESDSDGSERVILPALATYDTKQRAAGGATTTPGPRASAVDPSDGDERQERETAETPDGALERNDTRTPTAIRALSPSAAATPVPPSAPRRPSRSENNQLSGAPSSASFRTRAIAAGSAVSTRTNGSDVVVNDRVRSPERKMRAATSVSVSTSAEPPDPELMAALLQEYAERTKPKSIDKDAYHRKMQRKYNELKAMRERLARLESELATTERERDDARAAAARSTQQATVVHRTDLDSSEELGSSQHLQSSSPSSPVARTSVLQTQLHLSLEETSYREKVFKLERALATTKRTMTDAQEHASEQHARDCETIHALEAKLLLEQQTNETLSKQLHEATAAFTATADELVMTQIALERERNHTRTVMEQLQAQTHELVSDHQRQALQHRVRNVVRTLGRDALHHKMEALHTRALVAEQQMRRAQLDVAALTTERNAQQQQLEEILSSSALKYHALAADGGVPGILARATPLTYGARVVTHLCLVVQILYEDDCSSATHAHDVDAHSNALFRMHIVCYEPASAQDDFVTFELGDIERLVPDHGKYLAPYANRKHERLQALAEVLVAHIHAGYKNGHLVIAEAPRASTEVSSDSSSSSDRREVNLFRTTRFVRVCTQQDESRGDDVVHDDALTELVVNEMYAASSSDVWWLEIRALLLESTTALDTLDRNSSSREVVAIVDLHQLQSVCAQFGSYRPSESIDARASVHELVSIHEELFEPVLARLVFKAVCHDTETSDSSSGGCRLQLVLKAPDVCTDTCVPTANDCFTSTDEPSDRVVDAPLGLVHSDSGARDVERVLTSRCIVRVVDVFYCVRFQEVWDAELMVEIAMEDPETLMRYCRVVREHELAAIARFLFECGAVGEDYAAHVTNGLPHNLHAPLCKLLKKHIAPIVVNTEALAISTQRDRTNNSSSTGGDDRDGAISIDSLLLIVGLLQLKAAAEDGNENLLRRSGCGSKWSALEALETELTRAVIDNVAAQLYTYSVDRTRPGTTRLQRLRRGCRRHGGASGRTQFVVVDIWSGFDGFQGLVFDVVPVPTATDVSDDHSDALDVHDSLRDPRRLVVTLLPLEVASRALGLDGLFVS